jgi:hypothetical protein|tara:strand:- start:6831 stop:7067 length:237 start_codon:yes stop_codon:yes gene_type:complete
MTKTYWNKKWGKEHICGISFSRLRPGKNTKGVYYTTTLKCGHRFCTYPLLNWVKTNLSINAKCPLCRKEFTFIDMLKI